MPIRSSYASQFPVYDLSEKKDLRFSWEPGCGLPRPQSCLLDLQNSFIKSEVSFLNLNQVSISHNEITLEMENFVHGKEKDEEPLLTITI